MSDRNYSIRIPIIAVLALLLASFVVPAQAAPPTADEGPTSFWSLVDDLWQSVADTFSGGGIDDGEGGPITDPDGQQLTAPQGDLDSGGQTRDVPPKQAHDE